MKLIHLRGTFPLVFELARNSGIPSNPSTILVSTSGVNVSSTITLNSTGSLLEYSTDGTSWGSVTFAVGQPINDVLLRIRAKATSQQSLASGSFSIGDETVSYAFSVSSPASKSVSYTQTNASQDRSSSLVYHQFGPIAVTLNNYDLASVSSVKPIVFSVTGETDGGYLLSQTSGSPGEQSQVTLTSIASSQTINLYVFAPKNKRPLKAYNWKVAMSFDGQTDFIAEDVLKLNGIEVLCSLENGGGKPASLRGICKRECSPTSVKIVAKKSNSSYSWTVTAPSGFRVSLANKGGLATSVSVNSGEFVDERFVYISLDPESTSGEKQGSLEFSSSPAGLVFGDSLALSGENLPAPVIPVFRTKNIVVESSSDPRNGFSLVHENTDGTNLTLNNASVSYSYSSSPYYLSGGEVVADLTPVSPESVWSSSIPSAPGQHAVRAKWEPFTEGGVSYEGGEIISYYLLLPQSGSSLFYGVDEYVEFEKVTPLPFGFSYSPPSPTAKNLQGNAVSGATCSQFYRGTQRDGTQYLGSGFPTYPGVYLSEPFYTSRKAVFQIYAEGSVVPHNFSEGYLIPQGSITLGQDYDSSNYQLQLLDGTYFEPIANLDPEKPFYFSAMRVEVVDATSFRLYQDGVTPKNYFDFRGSLDFFLEIQGTTIASPMVGSSSFIKPLVENQVISNLGNILIRPRQVYVSACPDNVYPNKTFDPLSLNFQGFLSSDSSTILSSISSPTTFYTVDDFNTEIPNDLDPSLYYELSYPILFSASANILGKYEIPSVYVSNQAQLFRKTIFYVRPTSAISKVYDGFSFYDYPSPLSLKTGSSLQNPTDVVCELSLTSFFENSQVGQRAVYPEITTSGTAPEFYLVLLDDYRILSDLTITAKTLTWPASEPSSGLSKDYDGSAVFSSVSFPVVGGLTGDEVFVSSFTASSSNVGSRSVSSVVLGGASSGNYMFGSITSGWNATPKVVISPRPLTLLLTAQKIYDGATQTRIPLLTDVLSGSRLSSEPIAYSPLAPNFDSGNAGSRTSTNTLAFVGGTLSNYSITFSGSNGSSGSISGSVTPAPLTLKSAGSFALSLINPSGIVYNGTTNASTGLSNTLDANTLEGVQNSELTLSDLLYSATLTSANRGNRSLSFTLSGLSASSPFVNNYSISTATRTVQVSVLPRPVSYKEFSFVVNPSTDRLEAASHTFVSGDIVYFPELSFSSFSSGGVTYTPGVQKNTPYYVRNVSGSSFQISVTPTGNIINFDVIPLSSGVNSLSVLSSNSSTNILTTSTNHGLSLNDKIIFTALSSTSSGISLNTLYYAKPVSGQLSQLQLTTSINGVSNVDLTAPNITSGTINAYYGGIVSSDPTFIKDNFSFEGVRGLSNPSVPFKNQNPSVAFVLGENPPNVTASSISVFSVSRAEDSTIVYSANPVTEYKTFGEYQARITFPNSTDPNSTSNYTIPTPSGGTLSYLPINFFVTKRVLSVSSVSIDPITYGDTSAFWPSATINFPHPIEGAVDGHDSGLTATGFYIGNCVGSNCPNSTTVYTPTSKVAITWLLSDNLNYQLSSTVPTEAVGVVNPRPITYTTSEDPTTVSKIYDGTTSASNVKWGSNQNAPTFSGIFDVGQVLSVSITNLGTYPTTGTIGVTFSAPQTPGGVLASGTPILVTVGSSRNVVGVTITNPGSGYTSAPTVTFTQSTIGANQVEREANTAQGQAVISPIVTVVSVSTAYGSPNAGASVPLLTDVTLSGTTSANYSIPQRVSTGSITKKTIGFSNIKSGSKMFDGNATAPIFTDNFAYTNLVAADSQLAGQLRGNLKAEYSNANAGTNKTITLSGILPPSDNYQFSSTTFTLTPPAPGGLLAFEHTITKRPLSVTPKTVVRYYGDSWPSGGVSYACPGAQCGSRYLEKTARPIVSGGAILNINLLFGGSGYSSSDLVTISPPNYTSGVQATATISVAGGKIVGFTLTNPGSGYTVPPTITVSGGTGLVTTSVVSPVSITEDSNFVILGLVDQNINNPIDSVTGGYFGDEVQSSSLVIKEQFLNKSLGAGLSSSATYVVANDVVFSRGLASNYEILTGEGGDLNYQGKVIILPAAYKNLNKSISETLWGEKCKTFGCRELSWFDTIEAVNKPLVTVDFFTPSNDGARILLEDSQQPDPINDPEYFVTEG